MKNKKIFTDLNKNQNLYLILLLMIVGGIFGFIYETIFYRIDLGYFVKRGTTFGPWIPIYAFGTLFIVLVSYKYRSNFKKVFLINCLVTGTLELLSGFIFDKCFHTRLWNYNEEILNFGNINGYICLRSVLFFGLSSLLLIYVIIPKLKEFIKQMPERIVKIIAISLITLFCLDIIIYNLLK